MKLSAYMKRCKEYTIRDFTLAAIVGAMMALVFVFIFPGKSISTLMHDVFHLPGPGAGIALVVGPFAVLAGFLAYIYIPKPGAFLTALVAYCLVEPAGQAAFNPNGMGKYPYFIVAVSFFIVAVLGELLLNLIDYRRDILRYSVPAIFSNVIFLIFWWAAIFPVYSAANEPKWPVNNKIDLSSDFFGHYSAVPILIAVAIIGALLISSIYPIIYSRLRKSNEEKNDGQNDRHKQGADARIKERL